MWGSWAQKPFCVPHFLLAGYRLHSAPKTFPEFQQSRLKQLLVREGKGRDTETREEESGNNSATLGQSPGSPSGIHITISLSCFADPDIPIKWEKVTGYCPQAQRSKTVGIRRRMMVTPNYLKTSQSEECPQADHVLLFEPLP